MRCLPPYHQTDSCPGLSILGRSCLVCLRVRPIIPVMAELEGAIESSAEFVFIRAGGLFHRAASLAEQSATKGTLRAQPQKYAATSRIVRTRRHRPRGPEPAIRLARRSLNRAGSQQDSVKENQCSLDKISEGACCRIVLFSQTERKFIEIGLPSRNRGWISVQEAVQACDIGLFPWLCKFESHTIVWLPHGFCY